MHRQMRTPAKIQKTQHALKKEPPPPTAKEADGNVVALPNRNSSLHIALIVLTVVAIVYALHAGIEIALPLALALVLKLMFQPVVDFLCDRLHLPQIIGALAVVISLLALTGGLAFAISGPASSWLQKLPDVLPAAKAKLEWPSANLSTYLQRRVRLQEVEDVATPNDAGRHYSGYREAAVSDRK